MAIMDEIKLAPVTRDAIIDWFTSAELVDFLDLDIEDIIDIFEEEILDAIDDIEDLIGLRQKEDEDGTDYWPDETEGC